MVECKSYVTQITVILTTKLTVLVIHICGVWGCSQEFFPSGITGFKLYLCTKVRDTWKWAWRIWIQAIWILELTICLKRLLNWLHFKNSRRFRNPYDSSKCILIAKTEGKQNCWWEIAWIHLCQAQFQEILHLESLLWQNSLLIRDRDEFFYNRTSKPK